MTYTINLTSQSRSVGATAPVVLSLAILACGSESNEWTPRQLPPDVQRVLFAKAAEIARDRSYVGPDVELFCLGLGPSSVYSDPDSTLFPSVSVSGAEVTGASNCASDTLSSILEERSTGREALLLSIDSVLTAEPSELKVWITWYERGTSVETHQCDVVQGDGSWHVAECTLVGVS